MDSHGEVENPVQQQQQQQQSSTETTELSALKVEEIERHLARLETSQSRVDDNIRAMNNRLDRMEARNERDVGEIKHLLEHVLNRLTAQDEVPGQTTQGVINEHLQNSDDNMDSNNDTRTKTAAESDQVPPAADTVPREDEGAVACGQPSSPSRTFPTIKYSELQELHTVSQGSYGTVFRGQHATLGDVAYKRLDSCVIQPDSREARRLKHEVEANILQHVNMVNTLAMIFEDGHYGIVLEYIEFGNLENFVNNYKPIGWHVLLSFARDVACGLHQLHSRTPPVVHGDIKIQNVLIGDGFVAKICDFGLSKFNEFSTQYSKATRQLSETTTQVPPERWNKIDTPRTPKCDVYGYAILLWEIFSRCKPFANRNNDEIRLAVIDGQRPAIDDIRGNTEPRMPEQMFQLTKQTITQCWSMQPNDRPDTKEISEQFDNFLREYIDNVNGEKKELEFVVAAAAAGAGGVVH